MKELKDINNRGTHFFITQLQVILLGMLIIGLIYINNSQAIYMLMCSPILILYMFVQYQLFWSENADISRGCFICTNCCLFTICCPIFFGVFFGIFNRVGTVEFEKVENCLISGQQSKSLDSLDQYSILSVNFDYQGQQYLGYGCLSNQYQGSSSNSIRPYKFYKKGDDIACRDSYQESKDDRKLNTRKRLLKGSSAEGILELLELISDIYDSQCRKPYKFSEVKLPSWMCLSRNINIEKYLQNKTCYVHFYNDDEKAKENGKNRLYPREQKNYPIISFESEIYYPKAGLVFLIILIFYPLLFSCNCLFFYSSFQILDCIGGCLDGISDCCKSLSNQISECCESIADCIKDCFQSIKNCFKSIYQAIKSCFKGICNLFQKKKEEVNNTNNNIANNQNGNDNIEKYVDNQSNNINIIPMIILNKQKSNKKSKHSENIEDSQIHVHNIAPMVQNKHITQIIVVDEQKSDKESIQTQNTDNHLDVQTIHQFNSFQTNQNHLLLPSPQQQARHSFHELLTQNGNTPTEQSQLQSESDFKSKNNLE